MIRPGSTGSLETKRMASIRAICWVICSGFMFSIVQLAGLVLVYGNGPEQLLLDGDEQVALDHFQQGEKTDDDLLDGIELGDVIR